MDQLPADCISCILAFTSPQDVCRLAGVSSAFRSVADSNLLWETFLPENYREIIAPSSSSFLNSLPEKALYFHLSDHPLFIDSKNSVSFSLDKKSGRTCYMVELRSKQEAESSRNQLRRPRFGAEGEEKYGVDSTDAHQQFLHTASNQSALKIMAAAQMGINYFASSSFPSLLRPPPRSSAKRRPFPVAAMGDDPIKEWILSEGKATQITRISPVGGGCINQANRYDTDAGSFFVKRNRSIGPSMFEAEALGLSAMYETRTIRVPKPFKFGSLPSGGSYIVMEYIEFGSSRGNQSELGRKLAEMHKAGKSDKGFGFDVNNTIGSTPQINTWSSDWVQFYAEERLGFQLKLALDQYGDQTIYEKGQRLAKSIGPLFDNLTIEPCLLHGDLWSGNISSDKNGEPVILDPACYYGHNEAEFGMSWCAGFGGSFYDAYFQVIPKQPGFEKRRDLYLLYHYLNHYNLFGSGYRSSAMSIIDNYLQILKA